MNTEKLQQGRSLNSRIHTLTSLKEQITTAIASDRNEIPYSEKLREKMFTYAVKKFLMECDEILEREIEKLEQQFNEL